ncbi:hypothetical protein K438DRAFT_1875263 [Mycena galopus ATCC 62051]|nr:hypothetical protein K438DRAFT_1875263 [Mycena galopus ATCC 62051]
MYSHVYLLSSSLTFSTLHLFPPTRPMSTTNPFSMRAIVLEQTERTRQSSKSDIVRFLEEFERKIAALQSQIDRERKIAALQSQIDRERACSAALRYIISPIYTLPVEVLAEIFKLAIGDYAYTYIRDAHRLSQVCVDWRQVVHGTPQLWAGHLEIALDSSRGEDYADGLEAWVARSAPLPIRATVGLQSDDISDRLLEDVLRCAMSLFLFSKLI